MTIYTDDNVDDMFDQTIGNFHAHVLAILDGKQALVALIETVMADATETLDNLPDVDPRERKGILSQITLAEYDILKGNFQSAQTRLNEIADDMTDYLNS